MKRDELANLGLTDEQINAVMEINGKDINKGKTEIANAQTAKAEAEAELAKYKQGGELFIDPEEYKATKAERDTLKAEREDHDLMTKLAGAGVSEKFRKFVLSEVKEKTTEEKPFDKAMEEYLAENEQYKETTKPFAFRTSSSVPLGGGDGQKNYYTQFDKKLRGE